MVSEFLCINTRIIYIQNYLNICFTSILIQVDIINSYNPDKKYYNIYIKYILKLYILRRVTRTQETRITCTQETIITRL
jgi:hypothetical protein